MSPIDQHDIQSADRHPQSDLAADPTGADDQHALGVRVVSFRRLSLRADRHVFSFP
jgi:hypothetical protein